LHNIKLIVEDQNIMKTLSRVRIVALLLALGLSTLAPVLAQADDIILVPFINETFDIQGVAPEGWDEVSPGVYTRGATPTDETTLIQQAASGMSADQLGGLLVSQLGIDALPAPAGTLETAVLTWTLYEVEVTAGGLTLLVDIALAETATTSYVVIFQAVGEDFIALHDAVFLPAVEAFAPLAENEADAGVISSEDQETIFEDTAGLYSVSIPTNWTADEAEGYAVLASPDELISVYIVVVDTTDIGTAEAAAWAIVDPDFTPPEPLDSTEIPAPGYEQFVLITYPVEADAITQVEIRVAHDASYVLIFEMDLTAAQQRQAQLQIIDSGFQLTAAESIDLSGVEPLPLTDELIANLESYILDALARFETPGAAVAIVYNGEIVYAKGFGVRDLADQTPVTPETRMMIGSTTKTMTTLLMAMLVDDGVMAWDTPVVDILPGFAVADPDITEGLTMQHLVCACTGVPRRDFELVFNANELTAEDIIESLATFEFFTDFGEAFQYSNQMVAAGGYIAALAGGGEYGTLGADYRALLQKRVLDPIGMNASTFDVAQVQASDNYASPYGATLTYEFVPISLATEDFVVPVAPAGALWSNVFDMGRYMITLMDEGVTPDGTRIVSVRNLRHIWEPQVAISASDDYALGWIVSDYHGVTMLSHAGNTLGYTSEFAFLPAQRLGIVVLTNQRVSMLNNAVRARFLELLYDREQHADEQVAFTFELIRQEGTETAKDLLDAVEPAAAAALLGAWQNDDLGAVTITLEDGALMLDGGEFVTSLRQFDPTSERMSDAERPVFIMFDPPLAGVFVRLDPDDEATLIVGQGVMQYTFTRVEEVDVGH
jgi:CubicO group peptidase (beta-lactamase class C family)